MDFLTEPSSLAVPSLSLSGNLNSAVVWRRFGDTGLRARLLDDELRECETGLGIESGFWVYGVCIVGTLNVGLGLARLGVGPPPGEELESADEAKDAFVTCSLAWSGSSWVST